jgi:putative colanic acid biosynthesis glycosyltransferase
MPIAPTFSVIVACKNPGTRLHAALSSVWGQRDVSFELIVVDSVSTDGSGEWLDSRRSNIATLIREPDRGIYDAMNKGIANARGEWIYFLGADDRLATDDVLQQSAALLQQRGVGVGCGEAIFDDGRVYSLQPHVRPLARNFVHHQATFYRRSLFSKQGAFDAALGVMADYELNLRLWTNGVKFAPMPLAIASCGVGGVSDSGRWRGYREEIAVRHRYFSPLRCLPWDVLSVVRFMRKKVLRYVAKHRPIKEPGL